MRVLMRRNIYLLITTKIESKHCWNNQFSYRKITKHFKLKLNSIRNKSQENIMKIKVKKKLEKKVKLY